MPKGGLPREILVATLIAVAIIAAGFSGFKPTGFATAVSTCQNINAAGSYQLTANLFSTSTCINITSSNTELDCNNFWINDTRGSQASAGINVSSVNNVTVHNCRVNGFGKSTTLHTGNIIVLNSTNVTVSENILMNTSGYAAIYFGSVNNSIAANNTILNTSSASGIFINASFLNPDEPVGITTVIFNNTVRNNTIRNVKGDGIHFSGYYNARFVNFIVENNTIEYTLNNGVQLSNVKTNSQLQSNTTISSNVIRHTVQLGIRIIEVKNITIKYTTIENATTGGVYIASNGYLTVGNNIIAGNAIYNRTNAVALTSEGFDEEIYNNTLFNNADGLVLDGGNKSVYNNTLRNHTSTGAYGGYGVYTAVWSTGGAFYNISNNTIESNNYGIRMMDGNKNNITGNFLRYNRQYAMQIDDSAQNYPVNITQNTVCFNNGAITAATSNYLVGNNTFCSQQVSPPNNTLYTGVSSFTVNVTNTFNTTTDHNTTCYLFVNGANVATARNVGEKLNTTFTYTPTAGGNWYTFCNDTFDPNTANSSVLLLASPAASETTTTSTGGAEVPPPKPKTKESEKEKTKDFILFPVNSFITAFIGKDADVTLLFKNIGEEILTVSTLNITGLDSSWLTLPDALPTIAPGQTTTLEININPPQSAEQKIYHTTATANANGLIKTTGFDIEVMEACDGCFMIKLQNETLTTMPGAPVYNTITITNVGGTELTVMLDASGDNRNWVLFSDNTIEIAPGKEEQASIEITPPSGTADSTYPINITAASSEMVQQAPLLLTIRDVPGCPACPAPKGTGACISGKQELISYLCNEGTSLTCQPVSQEVSCALVKKRKLLLPFWEAPLEHAEANLWWIIIAVVIMIVAYGGYRYYKRHSVQASI